MKKKFIEKLRKFEHYGDYEKFILLTYYFYNKREVFWKYEENLLILNKLNKNFNFLKKSVTNGWFADALHNYTVTAIKNYTTHYNKRNDVYRGFDAEIKLNNFIFFEINEYVTVEKKIFDVKLKFSTYTFDTFGEMFAVLNLTNFASKHSVFNNDPDVKKLLTKAFARNIELKKVNFKNDTEEKIPF